MKNVFNENSVSVTKTENYRSV